MRVLLDEQLPRQLVDLMAGHDVTTVQRQAWAGMKNGELLAKAAESSFEVFLTSDQNLEFQQNLSRSPLGVVVMFASSNALEDLRPLIPETLKAIDAAQPGQVRRVAV